MAFLRPLILIRILLLICSFAYAQKSVGTGAPSTGQKKWFTARTLKGVGLERNVEIALPLRTHTIYAPYVDSDLQNRWFSFGADSYVNTNKHIRTSSQEECPLNADGYGDYILTSAQVDTNASKITGQASHLYGDGMAIWLTKERAVEGPVFCSKDQFDGLGIFIDTYANTQHSYAFPRIMAMLGDGKTPYDLGNDGKANSIAACSAKVRRTDITTKLRMTYFRDDFFQVQVQYKGFDDWTDCFVIKNFSIPLNPFLGVTAQTGDVFDEHDVIAINTHSVRLAKSGLPQTSQDYVEKSSGGGGFFWTLLKLIFFGAVCAVGFVAWKAYQAKKGNPFDAKRF